MRYFGQTSCEMAIAATFHNERALHICFTADNTDLRSGDGRYACPLLDAHWIVFRSREPRPGNAWTTQHSYRWVTTAFGLSILLCAQMTWNRLRSFWLPFLVEARSSQQENAAHLQNLLIPQLEVCENDSHRANQIPYTAVLRVLGSMMKVKRDVYSFARLISFPARLTPDFVDLILRKDAPALIVLSYWVALGC
jgi:hypothetical protein